MWLLTCNWLLYTFSFITKCFKQFYVKVLCTSISFIYYILAISHIFRVNKSRKLRWAGHVARMEEGRNAFKSFTGKPTGKRPLGRPRRRWEDNIRIDIKEIGFN